MDKIQLTEYALSKEGAYLDFPFAGEDYAVVKVGDRERGNRIFAEIFILNGEDTLTFSTDADTADFLREKYPSLKRGWHCPPLQAKYKSSATIVDFEDETLLQFVDASYVRALSKL